MENTDATKRNVGLAYVALSFGALMVIFGCVYIVYKLSLLYGVGLGAATQSLAYNNSISVALGSLVLASSAIRQSILESFIAFVLALVLGAASFILLLSRRELPTKTTSKYTMVATVTGIIFILLYWLATSSIPIGYGSTYELLPYFGFVVCVGSVGFIEYVIRTKQTHRAASRGRMSMAIDPSKPFSNMMTMQQDILSNMSGHIRVIDKHFNSTALQNFYRLVQNDIGNFTKFTILTSREMMTASFPQEISDFKKELTGYGIELDARLMDPKDTVEQHERIMLDDKTAYKVPPFNIINKRSEHITKINFKEADSRFATLLNRAIKLDNYQVEKDRK